jgi:CDP-glycerol glycerophosphotransferase
MADLSLITDVMITDYSSLMFDYVNTGRPILFFTYDLDHYRDTLRGFYFDFENSAPGPLVYRSEDLVTAIREIDGIQTAYTERYRWFQGEFCDLDDGYASARLADRLLIAGGDLAPEDAKAPAVGTVDTRHTGRALTPIQWNAQHWFSPQTQPQSQQFGADQASNAMAGRPGTDGYGSQGQAPAPQQGRRQPHAPQLVSTRVPLTSGRVSSTPHPDGRTYEGVIM